ncbi:MAG: hypothetical protein WC992_00120 [Acholeplasmataceae bacterium]|jgi:hypothetical protein
MDDATGLDTTGSMKIPNSFLLDLYISLPSSQLLSPGDCYISSVSSYTGGYVVMVANNGADVAMFTVPAASHTRGRTYAVVAVDSSGLALGHVAVGDLTEIDMQPPGDWLFTAAAARFQPRCVIPTVAGIPGVRIRSGGVLSDLIRSTLVLESGRNTRLRVQGNEVFIDAIPEEEMIATCAGDGAVAEPICTINGVPAGENGNLLLTGSQSCLNIEAVQNGLRISDTCASPCCGCEELDVINNALQYLRNEYATLNSFAERLEETSEKLQTVMAATALG